MNEPTTEKTTHTPGKLKSLDGADHKDFAGYVLLDQRGILIADCNIFHPCAPLDEKSCRANARRLAACWNAFGRISTESIERLDPTDVECALLAWELDKQAEARATAQPPELLRDDVAKPHPSAAST